MGKGILGEKETFQQEGQFFDDLILKGIKPTEMDLKFLEETIRKYPYFQTARLVYTKILKNTRSFKFHENLKTTAIYSPNRTVLFKYLNPQISAPENEHLQTEEKSNAQLEEQMNRFADTEGLPPDPPVEEMINFNLQEIPPNEVAIEHRRMMEQNTFKIDEVETSRDISNVPVESSLPKSEPIKKSSVVEPAKNLSGNRQLDLMNKFIKHNPKISPAKMDYSEENEPEVPIAQDFQSQALMTETLAQVYVEQGLHEKAIRTYKLLSLKYPQKSGYFADQVKKIQKQRK